MIWYAQVTVPLTKFVPTEDGRGRTSVPAGTRAGQVQLEIDVDALIQSLGAKALKNKTRKARIGAYIVARVKREWEAP